VATGGSRRIGIRLPTFDSACARAALEIDAIAEPALESAPGGPVALIVRALRRS
jgi:hypothetical protein